MISKVIPDYAKDFKNEYLFILGINNEFKYFLDNMNEATRGLFENFRVDKIKKFIKLFLAYQNLGQFKDVSNFEIKSSDIKNLIKIKKILMILIALLNIKKIVIMEMNKILLFPILVSKIFMMILYYFVVSLK